MLKKKNWKLTKWTNGGGEQSPESDPPEWFLLKGELGTWIPLSMEMDLELNISDRSESTAMLHWTSAPRKTVMLGNKNINLFFYQNIRYL
jgi:hypothetical protein